MIFYYPANGNRSLARIIEVLLYYYPVNDYSGALALVDQGLLITEES
jgi:hypothetical protein